MARYILLCSESGYIFGDTADYAAGKQADIGNDIVQAARLLDESIGGDAVIYREHARKPDCATGYHVYRADINGSEAVPVVTDGQDRETIESVERDCEYMGFVERTA